MTCWCEADTSTTRTREFCTFQVVVLFYLPRLYNCTMYIHVCYIISYKNSLNCPFGRVIGGAPPSLPKIRQWMYHTSHESSRFKNSNELSFALRGGHYLWQPEEKSHVLKSCDFKYLKHFEQCITMFSTTMEGLCSQLSFDAVNVKIGQKKAKLTFVKIGPTPRPSASRLHQYTAHTRKIHPIWTNVNFALFWRSRHQMKAENMFFPKMLTS